MRRFFVEPDGISGSTAVLGGTEARHLRTVLRLEPGEIITLFDGQGMTYRARIDQIGKDTVTCIILAAQVSKQTGPALHMGQALLTGPKMDLVIQKATELGVAVIQPFTARRCTATPGSAARQGRWQRIAVEACKQSGRPTPPEVAPVVNLDALLARQAGHDLKLLFYEEEQGMDLADIFEQGRSSVAPASVLFLIGPEGGFTEDEAASAKNAGFLTVSLGPRILRAETASIAAAAILQFLLGGMHITPDAGQTT